MKQLIVNADDFNFSPGVNEGILRAFREGAVSSTTVMVNMPGFEESARLLRDCPGLGTGVHIVLTKGAPVLPCAEVPSLIAPSGAFKGREVFAAAAGAPDEILREARAQIEKAIGAGLRISHIDSHHHTHQRKEIGALFVRLAREYGLAIRAYPETQSLLAEGSVLAPQRLITDFYADEGTIEKFCAVLNSLKDGVSEICCHPGIADEELRRQSSYAFERERELDVLTSPHVRDELMKLNISLISFNELKAENHQS